MGINNPWEIKITPSYQKLLDYWNNKGPKPSKEEAQTSLDELISLIQLPNNQPHADVIDAMFRQVKEQKLWLSKHIASAHRLPFLRLILT
jgi:phosphoribosylcarboxyaminoimidazole (NCAIR) mutase